MAHCELAFGKALIMMGQAREDAYGEMVGPPGNNGWFGQGGENLGEESEATKSTQFLVGNITNRTERGLAAFGMAGRPRNQNDPETPSDPNKKKKVGAGDSPASGSANDSPSV